MANSLTATITAPIGPGDATVATAVVGARAINFNNTSGTCEVVDSTGKSIIFDANTVQTITATASSGVWTFTVST